MAVITTTLLPPPVQTSFSYKLLAVPTPNFIHTIPALRKKMPAKGGNQLKFRRYSSLGSAIVPLGNSGATPPPKSISKTDILAQPDFYGTYLEVNEQVTLQAQDPVLNEFALRLGVCLRQTEDEVVRDVLGMTASVVNCSFGGNGDVPTDLTREDIADVYSQLMDNDAMMILDGIEGADKYDTAPVRDAYFGLASTKLTKMLNGVQNFVSKNNYPDSKRTLRSEWGCVDNVRFLLSSVGKVIQNGTNNGNDLAEIYIVAQEGYAVVEQDNYTTEFIYRPPIFSGPLAQNATCGFKTALKGVLLNDSWVFKLRCSLKLPGN